MPHALNIGCFGMALDLLRARILAIGERLEWVVYRLLHLLETVDYPGKPQE